MLMHAFHQGVEESRVETTAFNIRTLKSILSLKLKFQSLKI